MSYETHHGSLILAPALVLLTAANAERIARLLTWHPLLRVKKRRLQKKLQHTTERLQAMLDRSAAMVAERRRRLDSVEELIKAAAAAHVSDDFIAWSIVLTLSRSVRT